MRKVFITGVPASREISKNMYQTTERCRIKPCEEVYFPSNMVMETMIDDKKDEEYQVVTVSYGTDYAKKNIDILKSELVDRGFKNDVKSIFLPGDDAEMSRKVLLELIDCIHQGDDIYVNIEFGKRPIMLTALYGIEIVDNGLDDVEVEGIFYGETRSYKAPEEYVMHDVSYLYFLGQMVRDLGIEDEKDLKERITGILSLGIEMQADE